MEKRYTTSFGNSFYTLEVFRDFKLKKTFLLLFFGLQLFSSDLFAQTNSITGTVKNQAGEPLPGATISAKGSNIVSTSDASGNFQITIPEKAKTLVVSFVGMETQEVNITGSTSIDVSLIFASSNLNDIVVVGYGTQKR